MFKVTPFEVYKSYLGLKNHFTRDNYDYQKYCGKTKVNINSFYKRRDRFFFEKLSRQKTDEETINFFLSNFISCDNPGSLWIGEMMREGEQKYTEWKKRNQSLFYVFREEIQNLFIDHKMNEVFDSKKGHPIILKKYLSGSISIETLVILDKILDYRKDFDKKLLDPVWEIVSLRIKKYSPFVGINIFSYKQILKEIILEKK